MKTEPRTNTRRPVCETDADAPVFDTRIEGDTAYVDELIVDPTLRGRGIGTRTYRD